MDTPRFSRLARALIAAMAAAVAPMAASAGNAPGAAPAAIASSTSSAASSARAALFAYLDLWNTEARVGDTSSFAENLVLRYAHSDPELRGEVRGQTSVVTQVRALARLGAGWQFRDVHVFPTLHDNVYFAQFTASASAPGGGATIEQNVVLRLELDTGKLVRLVEFANPAIRLASRTGHAGAEQPAVVVSRAAGQLGLDKGN